MTQLCLICYRVKYIWWIPAYAGMTRLLPVRQLRDHKTEEEIEVTAALRCVTK